MCSNQSPLAAWRGSRLDWAAFRDGFTRRAAIFLHLRSSSLACPLSGSHLHCPHGARLDFLAPVLDCFLRRSLHLRGRKFRHWTSAAVVGLRCGTDVRAVDRNNSPTVSSLI